MNPAGKMVAAPSRPFDYLEGLPGTVFFKLYQQPSTALAIFRRMLPDLGTSNGLAGTNSRLTDDAAKCFVMALLYLKDPLPAADLEVWVKSESLK